MMLWLAIAQVWCMLVAAISFFPDGYNIWYRSANRKMRRDKYHPLDWFFIASFIVGWIIVGYSAIYGSLWFLPNYIGDGSVRHAISMGLGSVLGFNLMWITQERAENKRYAELKAWMREKDEEDARKGRVPRSKPSD